MNDQAWIERANLAIPPAGRRLTLPLAPSLEKRRLQVYLGLLVVDALALLAAMMMSGFLYLGDFTESSTMRQAQLLIPIYWTVAINFKAYSLDAIVDPRFSSYRALGSLLVAAIGVVFVAFFTKSSAEFSRVAFAMGVIIGLVLLGWVRDGSRAFIRWHCGVTGINTLVIDDRGDPVQLPHAFHIDAAEHGLVPDLSDPHMLNRIGRYLTNMDRVVVSCPPERRSDWAQVFKGANVQGEVVDREVRDLGVLGARRGHDFGALVVSAGPLGIRARVAKRMLDLVLTIPAIVVLAPLFVLVSLLIKLEDRGPILFVQRRMGQANRFFPIYKFRSMRVERLDGEGHRSASRDDDRVTRIGAFIRRTSIDELPQLFNVLKGDMSLVGPRPHALGSRAGEKQFWEVDERYWLRHSLKPGLTGLAQVRGFRGATDTESDLTSRLQSDLEYIDGWTVWRDIRIIAATTRVLIHDRAF
jgi:lipopolysaccharide/colanic/teichoic acid biosynthesis glycosyltransferase